MTIYYYYTIYIIMRIYYISLTVILPQSDLHNDNPRGPRLPLPSGGPETLSVPLPSPSVTLAPALLSLRSQTVDQNAPTSASSEVAPPGPGRQREMWERQTGDVETRALAPVVQITPSVPPVLPTRVVRGPTASSRPPRVAVTSVPALGALPRPGHHHQLPLPGVQPGVSSSTCPAQLFCAACASASNCEDCEETVLGGGGARGLDLHSARLGENSSLPSAALRTRGLVKQHGTQISGIKTQCSNVVCHEDKLSYSPNLR